MPAATPLPRGPSVLTLYSALDLLTGPGCPVCRYATESSDRYLAWFALEGHAQPETITRLCACLGTCARHTRRLMSQPGAAVRLTVVYRYVVAAARDCLTGRSLPMATCPACDHDAATAGRALDTLMEDLDEPATMYRCRELGGVCMPHLSAAAVSARRQPVGWLTETMQDTIMTRGTRLDFLFGADPDAQTRAVLRGAMPPTGAWTPATCPPCLASALAERDALERLAEAASDRPDPAMTLCAVHLADAAAATDAGDLRTLVRWQARCLAASLDARPSRWLLAGRARRDPAGKCAVCRARRDAELAAFASATEAGVPGAWSALCVRHHLVLRAADPRASHMLASAAVDTADGLVHDLADAFDNTVRARSRGAAPPDSGAWRRAAAFLDGSIFGGYPPPPR
jgi:hypothetical protein